MRKPKCTIIASFSNPEAVLKERERLEKIYDIEILLPTREWFDRMKDTMGSNNACSGHITDETILTMKSLNMEAYFTAIREAEIIHVFNVKFAKNLNDVPKYLQIVAKNTEFGYMYEYYGMNTLVEIGMAHCLGKKITSKIPPTETELRSLVSCQI